ncbi:MAG: glycosyltransferase family 4 protein [Ignavibacteriales bacterium]|nr:glycosyltransferase family 4 protein [Ignavibacteriales bacterium]
MKNNISPKRILFHYMLGIPTGGSDHSLYNHLKQLDKKQFYPVVFFSAESLHYEKLQKLGIEVHIKKVPKVKKKQSKEILHTEGISKKVIKTGLIEFLKVNFGREIKALVKTLPEVFFLYKEIKKNKIDILHTNFNLSASRGAVIAGIIARIPVIVHNRGLSNLLRIDVLLSRFVKEIICISDFVKKEYTEKGISEKKCRVIFNGVDTEKFIPSNNEQRDKLIIASVGRLEKWKGQSVLIKAASMLLEKYKNIEFWLIGNGSEKNNLVQIVELNGIKQYVKFLGEVNNVNEYLTKVDIFVHTSIEPEPFGRVIIESMACRLPVVATKIGGPLEIIDNNVNGILIEPNNVLELVLTLEILIKDFELRKKLGQNALTKVLSHFSIQSTTLKIQNSYLNNE